MNLSKTEQMLEDDVKLTFFSEILKPMFERNHLPNFYKGEKKQNKAGKPDGVFKHILFEYKKPHFFQREENIDFLLYGDNKNYGANY